MMMMAAEVLTESAYKINPHTENELREVTGHTVSEIVGYELQNRFSKFVHQHQACPRDTDY
jgi:hypothetical protein